MKPLLQVMDLPVVTHDGRLVARRGYDEGSQLMLEVPRDWEPVIPSKPTPDNVRDALVTMVRPLSAYRPDSPESAGGSVSALIAAVERPVMRDCPGILVDAESQAAGKTKLASALGAIREGRLPAITPFIRGNEEELKKLLFSCALGGTGFVCIDNVVGHFKSPALSGVLTSGRLRDRVLGKSEERTVEVRALITMTGNNASVDADMLRRLVHIRIYGGADPARRAFPFDPVTTALAARREIAVAVCVLLRAYFNAGAPDIVSGDAGGYAHWNRLCRQPVLWAAREGLADRLPWKLGDPGASLLRDAAGFDPEIGALGDVLRAAHALAHGGAFTAAQASEWDRLGSGPGASHDEAVSLFSSAVRDLADKGFGEIRARAMGRILENRRDRVVGGLKLLSSNGPNNTRAYRVVQVARESPAPDSAGG